jgi:hypothetical protein
MGSRSRQSELKKILSKIEEVLVESDERLKNQCDQDGISFLRGYRMAMSEVAGWIELYNSK